MPYQYRTIYLIVICNMNSVPVWQPACKLKKLQHTGTAFGGSHVEKVVCVCARARVHVRERETQHKYVKKN